MSRGAGRPATSLGLLLIVSLAAGCVSVDVGGPQSVSSTTAPAAGATTHPVACRPVHEDGSAVVTATCRFRFPSLRADLRVNATGVATRSVTDGDRGTVAAEAPGALPVQAELTVRGPTSVRLVLATPAPATNRSGDSATATPTPTLGPDLEPLPTVSVLARNWRAPVTVLDGSGLEPHLVVDADGRIYYSPVNDLYRSTDGGLTFELVSPSITEALPVLGGDTSVQVAPDGSVWWSRYWGYAGGTIGCTSSDHADTWTCDNLAIPGPTDRMWIAGKDAQAGYLQTNIGLYQHVWAQTTTGSQKYTPTATTTSLLNVRNGNMVYDAVHDAFWQIEYTGDTQRLYRVDGATGLLSARDTGVPNTYAIPWLSVHEGVLWTTGEPDSGAGVLAARSTDSGQTWRSFSIDSEARSVSFSYIAAGPDGRVVLVYYGSDKPGPSADNGGRWSLYVAETDNGLDAQPVWVETRLVEGIHDGNLCIGLNCEDTGGDPEARFAGDLIGVWVDGQGDAHLAYMEDRDGQFLARYMRQAVG